MIIDLESKLKAVYGSLIEECWSSDDIVKIRDHTYPSPSPMTKVALKALFPKLDETTLSHLVTVCRLSHTTLGFGKGLTKSTSLKQLKDGIAELPPSSMLKRVALVFLC